MNPNIPTAIEKLQMALKLVVEAADELSGPDINMQSFIQADLRVSKKKLNMALSSLELQASLDAEKKKGKAL